MKNLFIGAVAVASLVLSACGGSGPCDTLKTACDACTNTAAKASCQGIVDTAALANKIVGGSGDTSCKTAVDAKTYGADTTVCKAANP